MEPSNIVLRRQWFRGDVLCCTPLLRAVRKLYPNTCLFFQTDVPGVLVRHPLLHAPAQQVINHPNAEYWDVGNFAPETCGWHLIDIMASRQFVRGFCEHHLEMYPAHQDYSWAATTMPKDAIVIAPGPGEWVGRNWPCVRWNELIHWLLPNHPVVVVGTMDRYRYKLPSQIHDLRGQTGEMQLAALMSKARLVVGVDGFPLHVAGAMRVPRVGLFGVTQPDKILCDAPAFSACSDPKHPLTGARHRVRFMSQVQCDTEHSPMMTISVQLVKDTITEALK